MQPNTVGRNDVLQQYLISYITWHMRLPTIYVYSLAGFVPSAIRYSILRIKSYISPTHIYHNTQLIVSDDESRQRNMHIKPPDDDDAQRRKRTRTRDAAQCKTSARMLHGVAWRKGRKGDLYRFRGGHNSGKDVCLWGASALGFVPADVCALNYINAQCT